MLRLQNAHLVTTAVPAAGQDFWIQFYARPAALDAFDVVFSFSIGGQGYGLYTSGGTDLRWFGFAGDVDLALSALVQREWLVVRPSGSLAVYYRNMNSVSWTLATTDGSFGSPTIDNITLGGNFADGATWVGVCNDLYVGRLRMAAGTTITTANALKESTSFVPLQTTGLLANLRLDVAATPGLTTGGTGGNWTYAAEAGGSASLVTPYFVCVGTSVEQGYWEEPVGTISTPKETAVGRSLGAVAASEAVARGYVIRPTTDTQLTRGLAIGGYEMQQHAADAEAGGLGAVLDSNQNPDNIVWIQGGLNDIVFLNTQTPAQVVTHYQTLTTCAHKRGCPVIAAAGTRATAAMDPTDKMGTLASGLLTVAASFELYADPGPNNGIYSCDNDLTYGLHPYTPNGYDGIAAWAKPQANTLLTGGVGALAFGALTGHQIAPSVAPITVGAITGSPVGPAFASWPTTHIAAAADELIPKLWFAPETLPLGWFDSLAVDSASGSAPSLAFTALVGDSVGRAVAPITFGALTGSAQGASAAPIAFGALAAAAQGAAVAPVAFGPLVGTSGTQAVAPITFGPLVGSAVAPAVAPLVFGPLAGSAVSPAAAPIAFGSLSGDAVAQSVAPIAFGPLVGLAVGPSSAGSQLAFGALTGDPVAPAVAPMTFGALSGTSVGQAVASVAFGALSGKQAGPAVAPLAFGALSAPSQAPAVAPIAFGPLVGLPVSPSSAGLQLIFGPLVGETVGPAVAPIVFGPLVGAPVGPSSASSVLAFGALTGAPVGPAVAPVVLGPLAGTAQAPATAPVSFGPLAGALALAAVAVMTFGPLQGVPTAPSVARAPTLTASPLRTLAILDGHKTRVMYA